MKRFLILLMATSMLSGCCSLAPNYKAPAMPAPAWRGAAAVEAPVADIYNDFGSAELAALIKEALAWNNDVNAAIYRVQQARARADIAGADLLPSVDATATAGKNYANPAHGRNTTSSSYRAGLEVNYELDLFGRNRSNTDAAISAAQAISFDKDALDLIVEADTAETFIGLLALDDRLQLARDNVANQQDVLRITQARFNAGTISALELAEQKTQLAGSEASIASLIQQREVQLNSLAVLVGKAPQDFSVATSGLSGFTLPAVSPVQPAELLLHRPDIRSAEASLAAANYDIGVARANFYPNFQLSASSGIGASPISAAAGLTNALAASIAAPIFHGGALDADLERTRARRGELEEDYKKTVLTSFQEVQNALAAEESANQQTLQLSLAAEQSQSAYTLAKQRFDAGTIDFQTLLDTQRSLFSAQDSVITAKQAQFFAVIDLFRALGGSGK